MSTPVDFLRLQDLALTQARTRKRKLNDSLAHFFEKAILLQQRVAVQIPTSLYDISAQNLYLFWQARKVSISTSLDAIEELVWKALPYEPSVVAHLKATLGSEGLKKTEFNRLEKAATQLKRHMSLPLASACLASGWIGDRKNLQGKGVANSFPLDETAYYIEALPEHFKSKEIERYAKLCAKLTPAMRDVSELHEIAQQIVQDIASLDTGSSCYIPLGWTGRGGQSSLLFPAQITKTGDSTYRVRLICTWENSYHQLSDDEQKLYPVFDWHRTALQKVAEPKLWKACLERQKPECFNEEVVSTFAIFISLFTTFLGKPLHRMRSDFPEVQKGRYTGSGFKALDMIVYCHMQNRLAYKLYKIEQKLLYLAHIYVSIKERRFLPEDRRDYFEIAYKAIDGLSNSLGKVTQGKLAHAEIEKVQMLLATVVDCKTRMMLLEKSLDSLELPPAHSLYRRIVLPHTVAIMQGKQSFLPQETVQNHFPWSLVAFDIAKLDRVVEGAALLLESLRPMEWLAYMHVEIISKLPLTTPDGMERATCIELMRALYRLSSLFICHAKKNNKVLSQHVLAIATCYRLQVALFDTFIPEMKQHQVSWVHLYEYMQSRGADLGQVHTQFRALKHSFLARAPLGKLKSDGTHFPLFDYTWQTASLDKTVPEAMLFKILGTNQTDMHLLRRQTESASAMHRRIVEHAQHDSEYDQLYRDLRTQSLLLTSQCASLLQMACTEIVTCEEMRCGPDDAFPLRPFQANQSGIDFHVEPKAEQYTQVTSIAVAQQHKVREVDPATDYGAVHALFKKVSKIRNRTQAQVLRSNPVGFNAYTMQMIASGPSSLSLDLLLSYYEVREHKLFDKNEQHFFSGALHTNTLLHRHIKIEPQSVFRLEKLLQRMCKQDLDHISTQTAQERILWIAEVYYSIKRVCAKDFGMQKDLLYALDQCLNSSSKQVHAKAALFLLLLGDFSDHKAFIRALFLFGKTQTQDPQDDFLYLEAQARAVQLSKKLFCSIQHFPACIRELFSEHLEPHEIEAFLALPLLDPMKWAEAQVKNEETKRIKDFFLKKQKEFENKSYFTPDLWYYQSLVSLIKTVNVEMPDALSFEGAYLFYPMMIWRAEDTIITLDMLRGLIWRNGECAIDGSLPPEYQNHPDFALLASLPTQRMHYNPLTKRYTAEDAPTVHFSLYPMQAHLDFEGRSYTMLRAKECTLPKQLEDAFSVWKCDSVEGSFIVCAHMPSGYPVPAFRIDAQMRIRPLDETKQLYLAEDLYYSEAACFERLGFSQDSMLIWLDVSHHVVKIELPVAFDDKASMAFVKNPQGPWLIENDTRMVIPFDGCKIPLLSEPFYLMLSTQEALMLELPIEEQRRRYYKEKPSTAWHTIFAQTANERACVIDLSLNSRVRHTNLYLAYLAHMFGQYEAAHARLKRWIRPLGRAYSEVELRYLLWLIHSCSEKDDHHPEAESVRFFARYHVSKHLAEFPLDEKAFPKDLQAMFKKFSSNRYTDLVSGYKTITIGPETRRVVKLDRLLHDFEEEQLFRALNDTNIVRRLYERLEPDQKGIQRSIQVRSSPLFERYREAQFDEHECLWKAVDGLIKKPQITTCKNLESITVHLNPFPFFRYAYTLLTEKK